MKIVAYFTFLCLFMSFADARSLATCETKEELFSQLESYFETAQERIFFEGQFLDLTKKLGQYKVNQTKDAIHFVFDDRSVVIDIIDEQNQIYAYQGIELSLHQADMMSTYKKIQQEIVPKADFKKERELLLMLLADERQTRSKQSALVILSTLLRWF